MQHVNLLSSFSDKHEFLEFLKGLREIFKGNINSKPYPICDYKVAFFGPLLFFE